LAKVAVELERALARRAEYGGAGCISSQLLAQGDGWTAEDVVCTSGPRDRAFEEQHSLVRVVIVAAGTFQYRCALGCELMTPGSVLLGNAGQFFECGHEHAAGDRCISFGYAPEYFERLARDAGGHQPHFGIARLPSIHALSPTVARICAGLIAGDAEWEELSIKLAAQAVQLSGGSPSPSASPSAVARVTRAIRLIERHPDETLTLGILAEEARLSRYHFLRTFERLTGVTPHQYVLRTRLREAAMRLATSRTRILDVALESGFGDASNFNRSFRGEFGVTPRVWKRAQATADSC